MYIREFGIPHILEICEIIHTNELVKLRGNHVDYIIAPLSAKDNEDFMKQALCCISINGIYWGQILYYT